MTKQDAWFIEERAVAFASLVLTERGDVKLHPGRDMAIDLLVEILKDGKSTLRFFGVQLVPSMDLPDVSAAEVRVLSHLPRDNGEASFPLCVFVIGVRKPEGLCRWTLAPVVEDGQPLLRRNPDARWHPLDKAGASQLIDQVNAWYDARRGPGPKPPGRRSKAST